MNNLVTKPFTYVTNLPESLSTCLHAGVHFFYEFEHDDEFAELIDSLYESDKFEFTEHDTTAGGDDTTRHVLSNLKVNSVPSFYFVVNYKVFKYFGPWNKKTIEDLYERLQRD